MTTTTNEPFVIVETPSGHELWASNEDGELIGVFGKQADAELFVAYASRSTAAKIKVLAREIAESFPDLNLSGAEINPEGELMLRLQGLIERYFPKRESR